MAKVELVEDNPPVSANSTSATPATPSRVVLPDELSYLITAFLPTQESSHRSKAYLLLASFCQGVRSSAPGKGQEPDPATESLVGIFNPLIISRLNEQTENDSIVGISFLTALFQVDWQSASSIFQQEGVLDSVMDSLDLFPSPQLSLEVAHLLGQACGHKSSRSSISSQYRDWLESSLRQTKDTALRAAAAMTLVKLSKGTADDADGSTTAGSVMDTTNDSELVQMMKRLVVGVNNQSSLADAIEGLAYLSVNPTVKETLSRDSSFLSRLVALVPRRKTKSPHLAQEVHPAILYGVVVIICNLCTYPPRMNEEQAQIAKLRRMAKGGSSSSKDSQVEDDSHVRERGRRLVQAGVLDVLTIAASLNDSSGIRLHVGRSLLGIIEDKENRGKVLQSGGAKALMRIIKTGLATPIQQTAKTLPDVVDLESIQALAKLAITAAPMQVFGPNEGAIHDAIRPLTIMLLHSSASLLQQFEALMALTNISSQDADFANRISRVDGLMNKVELLLLEEHTLLRRAAVELLCNLIAGSEYVFERYGGTDGSNSSKSKLQVLLALSDVEDLPTRLAASGALATLTTAPPACRLLYSLHLERHRLLPTFSQLLLLSPNDINAQDGEELNNFKGDLGLMHRGVICTRNFLLNVEDGAARVEVAKEAKETGVLEALINILKATQSGQIDPNPAIVKATTEALKVLMDAT